MAFRDDEQRSKACKALLGLLGLEHVWSFEGPTADAERWRETGGALQRREHTMLLLAWAFWDGTGGCRFTEMLEHLDRLSLLAACGLTLAVKEDDLGGAVDAWLAEYDRPNDPAPSVALTGAA